MKKKIIFMVINMNVGGTEKALLNMLEIMPKDQYEITILMLEKKGGFLNYVPEEVHVEYLSGYKEIKNLLNNPPKKVILKFLKQMKLIKAFLFLFLFLISTVMKERSYLFKYILRNYPVIKNEYDVAIAYAGPMDFISFFVINKVRAKKKIQWIHFDVTEIGFNRYFALKIYNYFDKIYVVSNEGKKKLTKILPLIKDKIETFYNILSPEKLMKMANEGEGFKDNFNGIRILTVGRLSKEKGQDITIPILAKLKEEGYNVRWYCIGEGKARKEYENLIRNHFVEDDFKLLGSHPNPYPFIKQCDIYVQPSRHEGYCITLAEARCLKKPIIATNFTAAREQIEHETTGIIVGFNEKEIHYAIRKLVSNESVRESLSMNLANDINENTFENKIPF